MPIHDDAVSYGNTWVQTFKDSIPWIWDGLVAENAVTLLSAPEKTGKTTLLSLLLDRRREGGQLLGRRVRPGRTLLCSEETGTLWALRQPPLDFGPQLEYHHPTESNPTPGGWRRFIDHFLELEEGYYDLLVIDTVMRFVPAPRNNPSALRDALHEFRVIAYEHAGVLLLHQASASRSRSRAGGPLTAFADILIDMKIPPGDHMTRRRVFSGVSRYPGVLQHQVAELNPEGTDYLLLPDVPPLETAPARTLDTVRQVLSESAIALTREEILSRWPESERAPHHDSLSRTLIRGCELGVLVRTGKGNKAEAFRYGLAQRQPAA